MTFSIVKHHGFTPILTGILPHGIIEIFAFLLFSTIGFESLRYVDFLKRKQSMIIKLLIKNRLKIQFS
ncbi:stage II sporulation protein M [Bacillus paranthracis]